MAISAYDPSGRLKKHALLGTSLAVDPTRTAQRGQFEELHKEAALSGGGREAMKGRLTGRFQQFGQPQVERLSEIAEQKAGFETEARDLRDPAAT